MSRLARSVVPWVGAVLLILLTVASGCTCGKKTDEEILKERIDCTAVHLYLASKIAILKADQSPEAKAARDQLFKALDAWHGSTSKTGGSSGTTTHPMSAEDVLKLAKALYELKGEGEELLASGDEKGLKPFLPILFDAPPELAKVLDLNLEHALLLSGMFILRFHPRSPVPIPDEIMLYEAWMTDSDKLLPGMRGFMPAIKATVYANNELCDLAAKEATIAEKYADEIGKVGETMSVVAGTPTTLEGEQEKQLSAAVRAIAHGTSAVCYLDREEEDKAVAELDEFLDACRELGVPEPELAIFRAYIALHNKDHAAAKKYLETARDAAGTDDQTKDNLQEIIDNLEDEDSGIIEEKLGTGFFAINSVRIVLRHLERTGVFDAVRDSEVVKTLDGYLSSASTALGKAKELASGDGIVDAVKKRVMGD